MHLLLRVQKYWGIGRLGSAVTGLAESNGAPAFFTQMLRVPFSGFTNDINFPSGDSCAAEISGSPKMSSRSMMGGCCATAKTVGSASAQRSSDSFWKCFMDDSLLTA